MSNVAGTTSSADLSTRELFARIADPAQFSGGGSVAALTAAGAAATALLVVRLGARRKSNAAAIDTFAAAEAELSALRERCFVAADHDLLVLDQLLIAQREMRAGGGRHAYRQALINAAESPLALVDAVLRMLELIESQLPYASRFTVSDLGAAAALARGAAIAALLTADVNIAMLRDEPGAAVDDMRSRADQARRRVDQLADSIESTVRQAIASPANSTRKMP